MNDSLGDKTVTDHSLLLDLLVDTLDDDCPTPRPLIEDDRSFARC